MWYQRLFNTPITEQYKIELISDLKKEFKDFYQDYNDNLTIEDIKILNKWYFSDKAQQELLKFIKDFWKLLNSQALHAMPAHDARHALFKVPIYAFKYIIKENITGWERIGIIGALGHDFGRWAEEHIFGNAQPGSVHSRMSFVLVKEFLENYDFPIQIKKMIQNSVLKHTTGANENESMPIKLTVSPDRDQLIGPEMVLRLFHHKPKETTLKVIFDEIHQESVMQALIKMYFLRLPGPLFSLEDELRISYQVTLTFCLMNVGLDKILEYKNLFAKTDFNEAMFNADIAVAKTHIDKILNTSLDISVEQALFNLLSAKNTCPDIHYKNLALQKLHNLHLQQKQILAKSLNWVNQQRKILDQEQHVFLKHNVTSVNDCWLNWLGNTLLENMNE